MQVPLRRGSSDSTAAVTKLAKPMLVMKRPRFSTRSMGSCAFRPLADPHLAAQHAGFDADVGNGLGEAESAAPGLAIFPGLRRRAERHVMVALLLGAAFVDRREGQAAGQAAGGGARIHPGQFESHQRQRQILRALDEAALRRDP